MLNSSVLASRKGLTTTQRAAQQLMFKTLDSLKFGQLTILEQFDSDVEESVVSYRQFGPKPIGDNKINALIEVKHPDFYKRVLSGGSIAAGEAYMDDWWDSPDLTLVMKLMALNLESVDRMEKESNWTTNVLKKCVHWLNRNSIENSKKNIHAHYDLGNDLYFTFLDKEMLYSSAYFKDESDTLEQAQLNKMERLCQQLNLQAGDKVIEIGTGWGAMAIYMVKHYQVEVTTTTISEEQHAYTQQRIQSEGLEDKITLLKEDYRNLTGQYDKLVSIEMIEAVGKEYLPSYIKKCQSLLKPGGLMAIQAITIADQRYDSYSNDVDFIQKYIFPGGFLPSVTSLAAAATKHSDLVIRDLFDIGQDYAKTLKEWRVRFNHAERRVRELGYDERFIRMWRYYFCYCEGGFLANSISTIHLTLSRPSSAQDS
ncbi:SAM-dependent methyltransferase [Vibrio maerlii]|uniref:SAM-dependent methyltransferase n=1 Tax=Vibrio maerlii TaxID=2231648 RepID=UPI000E3D71B0|nr:cyclopropane-fatty-acyl-phospholipid synthase family protein [Vibrio maerlii]